MGGELVSGQLPSAGDGGDVPLRPSFAYETFYKVFPFYLSIGMTAEQFWDGDCTLVKYYREADEIRLERKNQELWLQGMYVYQAIADIAPVLHAFAKKGTKMHPYRDHPYPLTEKSKERDARTDERLKYEKIKRKMEMYAARHNEKYKKQEVKTDG